MNHYQIDFNIDDANNSEISENYENENENRSRDSHLWSNSIKFSITEEQNDYQNQSSSLTIEENEEERKKIEWKKRC